MTLPPMEMWLIEYTDGSTDKVPAYDIHSARDRANPLKKIAWPPTPIKE